MGEIADMMCDGTLDAFTGEYIGNGSGYPRYLNKRGSAVPVYGGKQRSDRESNINRVKKLVIEHNCQAKWYKVAYSFLKVPEDQWSLAVPNLGNLAQGVLNKKRQFVKYCIDYKTKKEIG